MKKSLKRRAILIGGGLTLFIGFALFLFFDAFYGSNFRTMQDTISSTQQVNLRGLRELQASGGTSVRFSDLKRRLKHTNGPKIIVDGMSEFHGYINGIPTTFFAYHKEPTLKHIIRRWIFTRTTGIHPEFVTPEEEEAANHGFEYKKVNIGSTFISDDEDIDKIITFYDNLPPNAWLHFHCAHGKGRTSILLVMLDILKNAPMVTVKDIVKRQHLLGSENLFNTEVWKNGTYDKEKLDHRKKFIEEFYKFVCQRKARGIQCWSDWRHQQRAEKLNNSSLGKGG